MSIIHCKHCQQKVDTDYNCEHEEECDIKSYYCTRELKQFILDKIKEELESYTEYLHKNGYVDDDIWAEEEKIVEK